MITINSSRPKYKTSKYSTTILRKKNVLTCVATVKFHGSPKQHFRPRMIQRLQAAAWFSYLGSLSKEEGNGKDSAINEEFDWSEEK